MTPIVEIAGYFNDVVLGSTPLQRWEALKNYPHNPMDNPPWLNIVGITAIILLAVLLVVNRLNRIRHEKRSSSWLFSKSAQSKNLTDHEYRMLWDIANNAGLKRNELIFSLPSAFDRGAAQLAEDALIEQGIEQSQKRQAELSSLREKLGFHNPPLPHAALTIDSDNLSSRQIPVKKKIYIRLPNASVASNDFEVTVVKNDPGELRVSLGTPMEVVLGQSWRCRYYSGVFVGEFETTVSRCNGDLVVLNHNDHIRLVDRRKILRVPVNRQAYVASFPFTKVLFGKTPGRQKKNAAVENMPRSVFEPPVFFPATVTELGGPGLRIDTRLEVAAGNRVLLMFKLNDSTTKDSASAQVQCRTSLGVIIEDIAIVRHSTKKEEGFSVALELMGLNDEGVERLIRAIHEAPIDRTKMRSSDMASGICEKDIPEPQNVQGN